MALPSAMTNNEGKQQALQTQNAIRRILSTHWRIIKGIAGPAGTPFSLRSLVSGKPLEDKPVAVEDKVRTAIPFVGNKQPLSTKNIKVITRQDLLNDKYELSGKRKERHPSKSRRVRRSSKRASSSPLSSPSPTALSRNGSPREESPMPSYKLTLDEAPNEEPTGTSPEPRHTFNGMDDSAVLLTVPLQRYVTVDSDFSYSGSHRSHRSHISLR